MKNQRIEKLNFKTMGLRIGFVLVSYLLLASCTKHIPHEEHLYQKVEMGGALDDARLPISLWKKFESHFNLAQTAAPAKKPEAAAGEHGAPAGEQGAASEPAKPAGPPPAIASVFSQTSIPKKYFSLRVLLAEKTKGVLGGKNHELIFPKGGGELDLSTFVSETKQGSFRFWIVPDFELQKEDQVFVYFLSQAKQREFDNETYGNGCNRYFNLTTFYRTKFSKEGIEVNTVNQRHVSTLGGIYFIVIPKDGFLNISYVTVKDSRHSKILCGNDT